MRSKNEGKARQVQNRRGSIVDGVVACGKVRARFIAKEPKFDNTLSWLDASYMDDRIVASSLEVQRENPAAVVILITGDINLQNNAAAARLPYAEPPSA